MSVNDSNTSSDTLPSNNDSNNNELNNEPSKRELSGELPNGQPPTNKDPQKVQHVYLDFNTVVATIPVFPPGQTPDHPPCPNLNAYDNPFEWPRARKNAMTWISSVTNGAAAYSAGAYAAPTHQLTAKWGISPIVYNLGITFWTVGFGIAPMFLAPFSEINGRRPVFIASGVLFVAMQLACGLTPTFAGMVICRFLAGVGGSTFSTMVGGILADIWIASERNTPMVLLTGATLFGTGLGPLISGFVAQRLLWRWVFYLQIALAGFLVGLVAVFFRETRGPIILARKAKTLNKWYEKLEKLGAIGMQDPDQQHANSIHRKPDETKISRIRYKVLAEEQRASVWKMLKLSFTRPAILLATEPILICFTLWISFSWSVLYLQLVAVPLVYETNYGFDLEQRGAVFTAVSIGGIISTYLSIYQDKWAVKRFGTRFTAKPEGRLWFTCAQALLMPIGMFWFGWTCYSSIHWIVPTIGLVATTMGIFSIFLATFNYFADVYRTYASSALAGANVCRNCLAGGVTIATIPMFRGLGFQAASSLLGGVGFLLAIGPGLLIWFGPQIRLKSRVARQFVREDEVEEVK